MNYFFSNLFRDKRLWAMLGLSALAGLLIMDILTFMLMPEPAFNLWVVKITVAAAVVGAAAYGFFLYKREDKDRKLGFLLPDFLTERRELFGKMAAEDPEFQTFCHKCRHFNLDRLGCLLILRERKAWIKLNDDSRIRYCLYWNLEELHPVMLLTEKLKVDTGPMVESARSTEETEKKEK